MSSTTTQEREINLRIMRSNIQRDSVGRSLTPEAQERAAEFAVGVWRGNMGNGTASQIGIRHVTDGVIKKD